MRATLTPVYAFGPFLLDLGERRLTRSGQAVAVPGKARQILQMLAEAEGRLVSHEMFRARLWPNVVVEDRTLTVHMSTLRKVLGANDSSEYIETVTGAGYRLAVPVRTISQAVAPPRVADSGRSLTVRPFALESGQSEADNYLGVGMADALTTTLGGVPGLNVRPVDGLATGDDKPEALGGLGAGHVLEGSVRRQNERLQVSAQLIDVASGRTQWSERFERSQSDAVDLQDTIAVRVADSLAQLTTAQRRDLRGYRPRSTEAFFLQLQARTHLKAYTRLPMMKALGLFEQTLALDPDYALAHAGLAWTYLLLGSTTLGRSLWPDEAMPLARKAAERAIALDARLAEAWAVLGRVRMEHDWDWDGAEADLAHAIALNPNSVEALTAYGQYLGGMGRHDEAIEVTERALQLDPRQAETLHHAFLIFWMADRNDRALAMLDRALVVAPQVVRNHYGRAVLLDYLGRHDEAMESRLTFLNLYQVEPGLADEVAALSRKSWREAMFAWLTLAERTHRWETAAIQWMAVGEPGRALAALETCVDQRSTYMRFIAQCPAWRPLHGEPRFQKLLRTLKLEGRAEREVADNGSSRVWHRKANG